MDARARTRHCSLAETQISLGYPWNALCPSGPLWHNFGRDLQHSDQVRACLIPGPTAVERDVCQWGIGSVYLGARPERLRAPVALNVAPAPKLAIRDGGVTV